MEELERLEAALIAAHEAGDETEARRIVAMIDTIERVAPGIREQQQRVAQPQGDPREQLIERRATEQAARAEERFGGVASGVGSGVTRSLFGLPTLLSGAIELVEDRLFDNRNQVDARTRMRIQRRTDEIIDERHPFASAAGEVGGVVAQLPLGGPLARFVGRGVQAAAPQLARGLSAVPSARVAQGVTSPAAREANRAAIRASGGRLGQFGRGAVREAAVAAPIGAADAASRAFTGEQDVGDAATGGAITTTAIALPLRGIAEVVGAPFARWLANRADSATISRMSSVLDGSEDNIVSFLRQKNGSNPTAAQITEEQQARAAMRQFVNQNEESADAVVRRFEELTDANGVPPSGVQVMSASGARGVGDMVSGTPNLGSTITRGGSREIASDLSERAQIAQPAQLSRAIGGETPRTSPAELVDAADQDVASTLERFGNEPVRLDDAELDFMQGPTVQRLLRTRDSALEQAGMRLDTVLEQRRVTAAAKARADAATVAAGDAATALRRNPNNEAAQRQVERTVAAMRKARAAALSARRAERPFELTISEADILQRELTRVAGENPNLRPVRDMAGTVRGFAARSGGPGEQYALALSRADANRALAEGTAAGRAAAATPTDAARVAATGDQSIQAEAGARTGMIAGLTERAATGVPGARRTSVDLEQSQNLYDALVETVGPEEANRLRRLGELNREAQDRLREATPARVTSDAEEQVASERAWASGVVVGMGRSMQGAFQVGTALQIANIFKTSPEVAENLARLAFDPARSNDFVRLVRAMSRSREEFRANLDGIVATLSTPIQRDWNKQMQEMRGQSEDEAVTEIPAGNTDTTQATEEPNPELGPITGADISDEFLEGVRAIESEGDPNAVSPTGAVGPYQFTSGTWLDTVEAHAEELGYPELLTLSDRALLELRRDERFSELFARAHSADNYNVLLEELGSEPSPGELYAAHLLGMGDMGDLMRASPDDIAAEVLPFSAEHNPSMYYRHGHAFTVEEFFDNLERRMQ